MGFETQMSSESEVPVNKNLKIVSMSASKISERISDELDDTSPKPYASKKFGTFDDEVN
jgi:hypothetical protein